MKEEEYTPVTKEILNSLEIGKLYYFISGASQNEISGTAYKGEDGNTYINFGNISVYSDWKIKL